MRKLLSIVILFVSISAWAQNFEGEIVYKITYVETPEEMEGMESMLPTEMNFMVSGSKVKLYQSYGLGSQTVVLDNTTKKGFLLMDMMGQTFAIEMDGTEEDEETEELNYTMTSEKRKIQGYACTKYVATNSEGIEVYVWATQDLKVDMGKAQPVKGINGFPVSFSSNSNGIATTCELVSVTKKVILASEFEIPEGYTITTQEELMGTD